MKSRLVLSVVMLGLATTNFVQAIDLKGLFVGALIMSGSTDAVTYRVHNKDHRTIYLYCKCGKRGCSRTIKPTKHAKFSCDPSSLSLSASVISGDGITKAVSIYAASPTKKMKRDYRTLKVTVGDCPTKHHLCGRRHKDKTTIFSRYFPDQEINSTYSVGFYDPADQSTEYINPTDKQWMPEHRAEGNLRGSKK